MRFFKSLFGPPDIVMLKETQNVRGLVKAAGHKDPVVQTQAIQALVGLGRVATSALLEQTRSEHESERRNAADLLERLGWQPEGPDERVAFLVARDRWGDISTLAETAIPALTAGLRDWKWDFPVRTLAAAATPRASFRRRTRMSFL